MTERKETTERKEKPADRGKQAGQGGKGERELPLLHVSNIHIATALRNRSAHSNETEPLDSKQTTLLMDLLCMQFPVAKLPGITQFIALYFQVHPLECTLLQAVKDSADLAAVLKRVSAWNTACLNRSTTDEPIQDKTSRWELQSTPCTKCTKRTFYVRLVQKRSADEPPTRQTHCTTCEGGAPPP